MIVRIPIVRHGRTTIPERVAGSGTCEEAKSCDIRGLAAATEPAVTAVWVS